MKCVWCEGSNARTSIVVDGDEVYLHSQNDGRSPCLDEYMDRYGLAFSDVEIRQDKTKKKKKKPRRKRAKKPWQKSAKASKHFRQVGVVYDPGSKEYRAATEGELPEPGVRLLLGPKPR